MSIGALLKSKGRRLIFTPDSVVLDVGSTSPAGLCFGVSSTGTVVAQWSLPSGVIKTYNNNGVLLNEVNIAGLTGLWTLGQTVQVSDDGAYVLVQPLAGFNVSITVATRVVDMNTGEILISGNYTCAAIHPFLPLFVGGTTTSPGYQVLDIITGDVQAISSQSELLRGGSISIAQDGTTIAISGRSRWAWSSGAAWNYYALVRISTVDGSLSGFGANSFAYSIPTMLDSDEAICRFSPGYGNVLFVTSPEPSTDARLLHAVNTSNGAKLHNTTINSNLLPVFMGVVGDDLLVVSDNAGKLVVYEEALVESVFFTIENTQYGTGGIVDTGTSDLPVLYGREQLPPAQSHTTTVLGVAGEPINTQVRLENIHAPAGQDTAAGVGGDHTIPYVTQAKVIRVVESPYVGISGVVSVVDLGTNDIVSFQETQIAPVIHSYPVMFTWDNRFLRPITIISGEEMGIQFTGGSGLPDTVADPEPNDGEYLRTGVAGTLLFKLSAPFSDPATTQNMTLVVRGMAEGPANITITLLQGGTTRGTWQFDEWPTSPATFNMQLTQAQKDSITNWGNLFLRLEVARGDDS